MTHGNRDAARSARVSPSREIDRSARTPHLQNCVRSSGARISGAELAPLWWTSRKGLLSWEFRQCSREKIVQIHSRKTLSVA